MNRKVQHVIFKKYKMIFQRFETYQWMVEILDGISVSRMLEWIAPLPTANGVQYRTFYQIPTRVLMSKARLAVYSKRRHTHMNTFKIPKTHTMMAFILGVGCMISDTRGPIWMKLWGYIELTLKLCIVAFLTSGLDLKTGNWNFPENPTLIPCNIFLEISDIPETESFPNCVGCLTVE